MPVRFTVLISHQLCKCSQVGRAYLAHALPLKTDFIFEAFNRCGLID